MKSPSVFPVAVLAVGMLSLAATTQAAITTTSPLLPPAGTYRSPGVFYGGGGLLIHFTGLEFTPDTGSVSRSILHGSDELDIFGGSGIGMMSVNGGAAAPASVTGLPTSVQTLTREKTDISETGRYDTEMLALDLVGSSPLGPFLIRESPTKQSPGRTDIVPVGSGFYIGSFFDVFTELSVDGGQSWMPSHDGSGAPASTSFGLGPISSIPEPSGMGLLGVGLVGMACVSRRRKQA